MMATILGGVFIRYVAPRPLPTVPVPTPISTAAEPTPSRTEHLILRVTAYTPTGVDNTRTGVTASGAIAQPMVTAAAPNWIPFGAKVWIRPLHRWFIVQDRGSAIHGHRLDLCMASASEAFQWGVERIRVTIRLPRAVSP